MARITDEVNAQVPGVDFDTDQLLGDTIGDMVGRKQPVVINLSAADPSVLGDVAQNVADAISNVRGVDPSSVNNGVVPAGDALEIHVDPAAAAMEGMTPADIETQANAYFYGTVSTKYLGAVQDVGVRVMVNSPQSILRRRDLSSIPISAPDGRIFPLGQVAKVSFCRSA